MSQELPEAIQLIKQNEARKHLVLKKAKIAVATHRSPDKADAQLNEDAIAVLPQYEGGAIIVLADGAGGTRGGQQASQIAIETFYKTLGHGTTLESDRHSLIIECFDQVNKKILDLGTGAGTTLIVIDFMGEKIRSYHVGDSKALLVGNKGKRKYETMMHSPTGYLVEAGEISEKEALEHNERHFVSNLMGDQKMRLEIGPWVELDARDTLVVASDGLFDNLTLDEITEISRKGSTLENIETLVQRCHEQMNTKSEGPSHPDDLSIVLLSL